MPNNPNSELVATTLLKNILSLTKNSGVGTTFPEDLNTISDGFVQIQVVGGSPDKDVPTRRPLIQVDCYVPSINRSKPKWGQAASMAEEITDFIYAYGEKEQTLVVLGPNFHDALVQSIILATEPRRVTGDPGGHARFTFDIQLTWVAKT